MARMRQARYRKVSVRIWNDAKFRKLSDDAQLAFLHLLTHPHLTGLGAMPFSAAGFAADRRWNAERTDMSLTELADAGMVLVDKAVGITLLPNFMEHNRPENPNVVKSWARLMDELPEGELLDYTLGLAYNSVKLMTTPFLKAYLDTMPGRVRSMVTQSLGRTLPEGYTEACTEKLVGASENSNSKLSSNKSTSKSSNKISPLKPRARDPIWDVVAELWHEGKVVESERKKVGMVVKRFREHDTTPGEIKQRLARYRVKYDCADTALALLNHWGELAKDAPSKDGRQNRRVGKYDC